MRAVALSPTPTERAIARLDDEIAKAHQRSAEARARAHHGTADYEEGRAHGMDLARVILAGVLK